MTTPVSSGSSGTTEPYGFEHRPYGWHFADFNGDSSQQADSAKPYGAPQGLVQQAPSAMRACVLALFMRRAGCHTREGGIDRGDGIATDGGRDHHLAPGHRLVDEEIGEVVIVLDVSRHGAVRLHSEGDGYDRRRLGSEEIVEWFDRGRLSFEDPEEDTVLNPANATNRGDNIVTDGGKRTAKAPIRDPDTLAALEALEEQYGSMAEGIRAAIRQAGGDGDRADNDLPAKALDAYDQLVSMAGKESEIGKSSALSLIAQRLQVDTKAVRDFTIQPLKSAGYVSVRGSTIVVHQEPGDHYDESTGHHDLKEVSNRLMSSGTEFICRRCGKQSTRRKFFKTRPCEVADNVTADTTADRTEVPADD